MADTKVSDLVIGDKIVGTYAVKNKSMQSFKNKSGQFLSLVLGDASGELKAVMWDGAEAAAELFESSEAITVRAKVEEYRGQKQLVIDKLKKADEKELEAAELLATTSRDPEAMRATLLELIESVDEPHLRALLDAIFGDEDFLARFCRAPGAKGLHHAYVSGLLEHTVGVCRVLGAVVENHPGLNRDLLITGALLHDLGKTEELETNMSIDYTDKGRLVGHIVMTDRTVTRAMEGIGDFPEELANRLTHLLLSHHGQKEYGAPVQPMTAEACAMHYADNLDAHVEYFGRVIADGKASGNHWSDFQRLFDRYLYIGQDDGEQVTGNGEQETAAARGNDASDGPPTLL